jgi:hypothetical protein
LRLPLAPFFEHQLFTQALLVALVEAICALRLSIRALFLTIGPAVRSEQLQVLQRGLRL